MLTGQFVVGQHEALQCRPESEFRRNDACAARRSFLDVGTLVYHPINLSNKLLTGQFVLVQTECLHSCAEAEFRRDVACAARTSLLDVGTPGYHFAIKLV